MSQLLKQLKPFFKEIPSFMLIGMAIALGVGVFIIFSYVLVWGLVIGAALWGVNLLVKYFQKIQAPATTKHVAPKGRIIEHDE